MRDILGQKRNVPKCPKGREKQCENTFTYINQH